MNKTQVVNGVHLPAWDTHFAKVIGKNPIVDGKGTYQYRKLLAALEVTKSRRHAVDAGAHVGLWSRILAKEFDFVTAFEPMPEHADCFEMNLAGLSNVQLERCALGDRSGVATMVFPMADVASARIDLDGAGDQVRIKELDTFDLRSVDFLKMDVEGFCLPILRGGEQTIRRDRPVVVVEQKGRDEHFGVDRFAATDLLKSWGANIVLDMKGDYVLAFE